MKDLRKLMQYVNPTRSPISYMSYPREFTFIRAFLYASIVESDKQNFSLAAFLAGCNRFGCDNPSPIITKRIASYGN